MAYIEFCATVRDGLLNKLSDRSFDPIAKNTVREWQEPARAADILRTLDFCVNGSLCSGFEIKLLEILLEQACKHEDTTYEAISAEGDRTWRKRFGCP